MNNILPLRREFFLTSQQTFLDVSIQTINSLAHTKPNILTEIETKTSYVTNVAYPFDARIVRKERENIKYEILNVRRRRY